MGKLPAAVQETIRSFGEWSMGVHCVALVLRNGRLVEPVFIAWGDEVLTPSGTSRLRSTPPKSSTPSIEAKRG
jgi:hypothetical protein